MAADDRPENADLVELHEIVAFLLSSGVEPRTLVWADRQLEARRPRRDVFVVGRRLLTSLRQGGRHEFEQYHAMRTVAQARRAAHLAQLRRVAATLAGLKIFSERELLVRNVLSFLSAPPRADTITLHVFCTRCRFSGDVFAGWEHVGAQHGGTLP